MSNKRSFEKFYQDHFDKVYRFIFFRVGGNKETAEDLASEIFMKALEHFDQYDSAKSVSAWIMTIARNHLFNHWRDAKATAPLPEDEGAEEEQSNPDAFWLKSALTSLRKQEEKSLIYELLAELEPLEAEIVTFHYLFGYNYSEIGQMKEMSEGAVKVAAHRAVKKLRKNY